MHGGESGEDGETKKNGQNQPQTLAITGFYKKSGELHGGESGEDGEAKKNKYTSRKPLLLLGLSGEGGELVKKNFPT